MRAEPPRDEPDTVPAGSAAAENGHPPSPLRGGGGGQARKNRFLPGDILSDRFVIIRFLGSGGMGEVYEAQDRFLQGASIALKTISPDLASSPEAQTRFEKEVLLARQVTHPNVCPIYDLYYHHDDRGVCCLLSMKLLRGETLAVRLDQDRSLPPDSAVSVIRQIAAALHAAHRAGIIHRDIKPSNIMLSGSGPDTRAIVMDFGLAREFDSDLSVGSTVHLIGTPAYMAPELIKGQPATAASDLYSFGLVTHEIFGGDQPKGFNPAIKLTPAVRATGVPPFLPSLITGCLDEDPRKRLLAFRQSLTQLGIDSDLAHATYQTRPFWTRRRWLLAAASAGCLLGGGTVWEWDDIFALFNPLPRKRFVALVNYPPTSDAELTPMLSGVIEALERELARAEAFDHDLYVIPPNEINTGDASLAKAVGSAGANLMLASSASSLPGGIRLSLKILDSTAARLFRKKTVRCEFDEASLLPEMAVRAAAELLGVSQYVKITDRLKPGTKSPEAYHAFQQAEALRRKPNDAGLEAAIEQYKTAVDQDSQFAEAYARLAQAFGHLYSIHHDPAALDLAEANINTALHLDRSLVDGHLVAGGIKSLRGQRQEALSEMREALRLDPDNPKTMTWMAQLFTDLNQFPPSEDMYKRVLAARPNYWLPYNEFGNLLKAEGKYQEALRAYASAHLAKPDNSMVLANVGEISWKLGLLKQSRDALEKSFALNPNGLAAAIMSQELRLEGKYREALTWSLKATDLDPSDDENWFELGESYSILHGHRLQAREAYARAAEQAQQQLKVDDADGPLWMRLARYQAKMGNLRSALATARKADELGVADLASELIKVHILVLAGQRSEALVALAGCRRRGATDNDIRAVPDLQSLNQ